MTVLWLIIWACSGAPKLAQWNGWAVALLVCMVVDVFGGGGAVQNRRRR